ncbi:hypothetical protein CCACVL1_04066 [Corchorus capsularis]|uniref:Uncharacterized protein n=1 Tax=Corchorus capsularis TaxID=210143 RepID=A0A1R3JVA1_COCAP|nr:hypothetical protein CCACVL1_04066 [Corchorus capsularis]
MDYDIPTAPNTVGRSLLINLD